MPTRPTLCSSLIADATNIFLRSALGFGHSDMTSSIALSQNTPIPGVLIISPPGTSGKSSGSKSSTALDTQVQCTSTRSSIKNLPFNLSSSSNTSYPQAKVSKPLQTPPTTKKVKGIPAALGIPPSTI